METYVHELPGPETLSSTYSANDVKAILHYIEVLHALSRLTHQGICLIDYEKQRLLYVSDHSLFLSDHTADQVKEMGYKFFLKQIPEKDRELLMLVQHAGVQFYEHVPVMERAQYSISYDFHINHDAHAMPVLVNHKLTPLVVRESGQIWLVVCYASLSTNTSAGHVFIQKENESARYIYNFISRKWIREKGVKLKHREKEILLYSAKGFTNEHISQKLYLSIETVKFHKKNIFKKLEVKNITEAIGLALNKHFI